MPVRPTEQVDAPRRRTSDVIFEQLRRAIVANDLRAGEPLSQVALAKQFGVSRIPVREALRQLAAEGFVVWDPGEMVVVSNFERPLLEEVIEIRTVLEAWLVDRAVDRLAAPDVEALSSLVASMEATADPRTWRALNDRFHETIYQAAQSLVAMELVERLGSQAERFLDVPVDEDLERRNRADQEHRLIVDRLQAGDVVGARHLLRDHLGHRLDRLGELLDLRPSCTTYPRTPPE